MITQPEAKLCPTVRKKAYINQLRLLAIAWTSLYLLVGSCEEENTDMKFIWFKLRGIAEKLLHHDNTCLWSFHVGPTPTRLYSHRR